MAFFDIDRFKEILDTLGRNKGRSLLTGFGVFWGIFMLLFLNGGGNGLKNILHREMGGFASNSSFVWAQSTSKIYKGFNKGRQWSMTTGDIASLKAKVPELDVVTPLCFTWSGGDAKYKDKSSRCNVRGQRPDYAEIEAPSIAYGRRINEMDVAQKRKVCVIGKQIYENLYSEGEDPCGTRIQIGPAYYQVVGVDYNEHSAVEIGGRASEAISIPISVVQSIYNMGNKVQVIAMTAKKGTVMSDIIPEIRAVVAANHYIDPTDEQAVTILNTEMFYMMMDSLFKGVNFLIWLIGIGTLLAGVIGVSNIMMVTVRERTTEIGIRRAIGATPKMILSQIIWESILLTAVAGMLGMMFSVLILQGLELGFTKDGVLQTPFQISFWSAVITLAGLMVLGVVAGLAPAARAMNIKPVDAMRDE
jgi:putative ABC transport system permease protein